MLNRGISIDLSTVDIIVNYRLSVVLVSAVIGALRTKMASPFRTCCAVRTASTSARRSVRGLVLLNILLVRFFVLWGSGVKLVGIMS